MDKLPFISKLLHHPILLRMFHLIKLINICKTVLTYNFLLLLIAEKVFELVCFFMLVNAFRLKIFVAN